MGAWLSRLLRQARSSSGISTAGRSSSQKTSHSMAQREEQFWLVMRDRTQLHAFKHQKYVEGNEPKLAVIVLHPHGWLAGSSSNHVVMELFRAAARHPLVHTVVRYNMRGVGLSQGSKTLWGKEDCQDVPTVCKGVLNAVGNHANLIVVGYSWGACVACHAVECPKLAAVAAVSPVAGGWASFFLKTRQHWAKLQGCQVPKRLVLGDADQYSRPQAVRRLAASCQPAEVLLLEGVDHFWQGSARSMATATLQWVATNLPSS